MSRPVEPVEPVRVGDRYVREDGARITITRVTLYDVEFSALTAEGTIWSSATTLPVPEGWTKAGSGPVPPPERQWCVTHPLREAEPGQMYCPECIDQGAIAWSMYTEKEAQEMAASLLKKQKESS